MLCSYCSPNRQRQLVRSWHHVGLKCAHKRDREREREREVGKEACLQRTMTTLKEGNLGNESFNLLFLPSISDRSILLRIPLARGLENLSVNAIPTGQPPGHGAE